MIRLRSRAFGAWALAATASAVVGCEALLDVGSLEERSADAGALDASSSGRDAVAPGTDANGLDGAADTASSHPPGADGGDGGCTIPPGAACAVDPQCGCPSDEKCDLPSGNAQCIGYGTSPTGEPCVSSTDCVPGTTCTNGVCHAFCTTPGAQCPPAPTGGVQLGICTENAANTVQGFLCPITCTPAPNNCGDQTGCATVALGDGGAFADCEGVGQGGSGDACGSDTDCQAGYGCDQAQQVCYEWCELSPKTTTCKTGTCHAPAAVTISGVEYSYCY